MLRDFLSLVPRFLRKRRSGLPQVQQSLNESMDELGIDRTTLFAMMTLRNIQGSYGGQPVNLARIRAYDPYTTVDKFAEPLSTLKARGLVVEDEEGNIALTAGAWQAVEQLHARARAALARLQPLPKGELEALTNKLEGVVRAMLADPVLMPRPGSHLAGSRSLATFGPDAPVMVRLEQAVYDLWMARDDAHMKAWRDAEMEGPPMAAFTLIWSGKGHTMPELKAALRGQQNPKDVEGSVAYLLGKEYIVREGDRLELTPQGVLVRDDIERETDRIYFTPWPPFTFDEARQLRDKLRELVDNLPPPDNIEQR